MKATKEFRGVRPGDIYPSTIAVGEEIPEELEAAAIELGCAKASAKKAAPLPVVGAGTVTLPLVTADASGEVPAA